MKGYQKHNSTQSQHGPFGLALRVCRNRISPPSLDVILAQVNCSDDQTRASLEVQFQVPGRTETVRRRGTNRFTPNTSEISYSKSDVRGSRLNTAQTDSMWKRTMMIPEQILPNEKTHNWHYIPLNSLLPQYEIFIDKECGFVNTSWQWTRVTVLKLNMWLLIT